MRNRNSRLQETKTFEYEKVKNRNQHDISNTLNNQIEQNESKRDGDLITEEDEIFTTPTQNNF